MPTPVRIHQFAKSGHCHRVTLFANLAGIDHELIDVDLPGGEHLREPFLTLNPFGQVPVIEDGSTVVADSNAILVYLARTYAPDWIPSGARAEAEVQRFLTMAAGDIAYGPAAARLITVFKMPRDADFAASVAEKVLTRLNKHMEGRDWTVGDKPTIADIALYSYIAHAPEGNVSLEPYPNVRRLLANVEALEGFVPMPATAVGLAA